MAEQIILTTPLPPTPTVTGYGVGELRLIWEPFPQIAIVLRATDGTKLEVTYEGAVAATMMRQLNKADLSSRSLTQRMFDRLIADGKIAGSVAGSVP